MMTPQDIYERLDHLASDAHKVACSLDVGRERTEAFALYTVLHRLQRRGAAMRIHDATNPLMDYVPRPSVELPRELRMDVRHTGPILVSTEEAVYLASAVKEMLRNANIEVLK